MSYTVPIPTMVSSPSAHQNCGNNKNVFIYRTEHVDAMAKYVAGVLSQFGHEAIIKEASALMDYNAKNIAFESLISIVHIRSHRDWKQVLQFMGSQFNQNPGSEEEPACVGKGQINKCNNQNPAQLSSKLIVVCEQSVAIPIHVQPRVLVG